MVFEDADLDSATNGVMAGIFGASGQSCVAGSRLYLHEKIADRFARRPGRTRKDDPHRRSARRGNRRWVRSRRAASCNRIENSVARAIEQGATLLPWRQAAAAVQRRLVLRTDHSRLPDQKLHIVDTEMFGPVLDVLRFREEEEVCARQRHAIWACRRHLHSDVGRAMRVAQQIRAGIVWINTYRVVSPIAEFGGFKNSGYGREGGLQAIYDYTRPKTVWLNTSPEPIANPFVMR